MLSARQLKWSLLCLRYAPADSMRLFYVSRPQATLRARNVNQIGFCPRFYNVLMYTHTGFSPLDVSELQLRLGVFHAGSLARSQLVFLSRRPFWSGSALGAGRGLRLRQLGSNGNEQPASRDGLC